MIRKTYPWLLFLAGIFFGLIVSNRLILRAQDQRKATHSGSDEALSRGTSGESKPTMIPSGVDRPPPDRGESQTSKTAPTAQDVLLRPYHFTFSRPTSLLQVCAHLRQTLNVPVVVDIAALGRQDVDLEDTVQLELEGVRLKTGLKLLLDQVALTYLVVPEDNLLIITDKEGSEDPLDRVWSEMKAMHRELHDVQDALDHLADSLIVEKGEGSRVRKPTIIEEMPDHDIPKAEESREKPEEPAKKPNSGKPTPTPRSPASRVPLVGPGRPL